MSNLHYLRFIVVIFIGLFLVTLPGLVMAADQSEAVVTVVTGDGGQAVPIQPPRVDAPRPQQGPPPKRGPTFLTGPNSGSPQDIALAYIRRNRRSLGLTDTDLADLVVKYQYVSRHNQVTHIYIQQRLDGIEVFNGTINVNIDRDGRVINLGNRFVSNLRQAASVRRPILSAPEAVERAANHLNLTLTTPLAVRKKIGGQANEVVLSNGGISLDDIPVKLMYLPLKRGHTRLVWAMVVRLRNGLNWWNIRVDAVTGEVLSQNDWIANDLYNVYALPASSPDTNPRTLALNPADSTASPFGWHDTDGIPGAEFSDTRGNNVFAQEDWNADDRGGLRPDGGAGLTFSTTLDLKLEPSSYISASIINLFYWNNILHDIHYHYGFDEASGNFQYHNYGRGGFAGDPVQADAQDGADRDNANFGTPPDPFDPRMQMFIWTTTVPNRDSALDNGIIIHEYGHGVSNRLTGGPHNVDCLNNDEQMGEGWSDLHTLFLTAVASDTATTPRSVGTYALGESLNGPGIRNFPYSTDMTINPLTYDDIKTAWYPHDVGEIWAAMVWEVYWNLIAEYGFDSDFYQGHGGNNLTMQLVMDGMKLQPCNPSFVEARDAILLADQINNGGQNQCHIWQGFAKRGLGVSAEAGSNFDVSDGREAFDAPPECAGELTITKIAAPSPAQVGGVLTYTLIAANYSPISLTNVTITDSVPLQTVYIPGSAGDPGRVIQWAIGDMTPNAVVTRAFQVLLASDFPDPTIVFADDMEGGAKNWLVTHTVGMEDWILDTSNPNSGSVAWFASDPDTYSEKSLILRTPITRGTELSFWHAYDTEFSYDGGVVEISTDGGANWSDLGSDMIENGYNGYILYTQPAFTGHSNGYIHTRIDLSPYQNTDKDPNQGPNSGQRIYIRFRMLSDSWIPGEGWYVDDVRVIDQLNIDNTAFLTSDQGEADQATIHTPIVKPAILSYDPVAIEKTGFFYHTVVTTLTLSNTGWLPLRFEAPIIKNSSTCHLFDNDNNDFERGDFNGWVPIDDNGAWLLNEGTYPRIIDGATTPPLAGSFSALADQLWSGTNILYRDFILPANLPGAVILSWTDQWENHGGAFDDSQAFRVALYGADGSPFLGELFRTQPGDSLVTGPTTREVDITDLVKPYAGQSIRLQFEVHALWFFFNVQVDDVQLCGTDPIWASTSPQTGVIAPLDDTTIEVIFKTNGLTQTGTYNAELRFKGNMANSLPPIPLRMHLVPTKLQFLPLVIKSAPPPLFFDDLESGPNNWLATGLWHLVADDDACGNSFSPTTSWYYGQDIDCTYDNGLPNSGQLTTITPISLPVSSSRPTLTFWSWESTEDLAAYDSRQVLISTDGINFAVLWDSTNSDANWYQVRLDLADYVGQNIWFRFEFDTIDDITNYYPGWYVDDIQVTK